MKRTLYLKLVGGYLIFLLFSFMAVTFYTYQTTYQYMEQQEAASLYREATAISSSYGTNYYTHALTQDEFRLQLSNVSKYSNVTIWIMDTQGTINIDSSSNLAVSRAIESFDVLDFGNKYYQIGNFYNSFSEDTLSVYAPITVNYKVRGYVLIHKPIADLVNTANVMTTIGYHRIGRPFHLCAFCIYDIPSNSKAHKSCGSLCTR